MVDKICNAIRVTGSLMYCLVLASMYVIGGIIVLDGFKNSPAYPLWMRLITFISLTLLILVETKDVVHEVIIAFTKEEHIIEDEDFDD